jgi:hypothetical protein
MTSNELMPFSRRASLRNGWSLLGWLRNSVIYTSLSSVSNMGTANHAQSPAPGASRRIEVNSQQQMRFCANEIR